MRRFILVLMLVAMLLPVSAKAEYTLPTSTYMSVSAQSTYVLPAHLRTQVDAIMAARLNAAGCPKISAALFIAQTATGYRGGPVTPEDSAWLTKLAHNIAARLVGNPPKYPDVVCGAHCV